jgi:large subunit ribosomal protein L30
MAKRLEVTYVRSAVGRPYTQRRTVEALGLRRLHQTVHHDDTPTVRGMIRTVQHLLSWREIEEGTGRLEKGTGRLEKGTGRLEESPGQIGEDSGHIEDGAGQ